MAQVLVPPLRRWPWTTRSPRRCLCRPTDMATSFFGLLSSFFSGEPRFSFPYPPIQQQQQSFLSTSPSHRTADFRNHGLRLSRPSELADDLGEETDATKMSRNEKKREALKAVRWGMDLANFSPPQIKRILRAASLEEEVFEALMLVKRLGPDVREGKRRQFSYIGRLLRKVQPELMDTLIQASKDGDNCKVQALSGQEPLSIEDDEEEEQEVEEEIENEMEGEGCQNYIDIASRWFEGLIYKDLSITNEVYSVHNVNFDRQELRKLVRRVHSIQERLPVEENGGENDVALNRAKKSLSRFLHSLAKQTLVE